jgi:rod shape-determining protein MreC
VCFASSWFEDAWVTVAILDIRQRAGFLFVAVTLGHILLISAQVSSRSGVPVLEEVTFGTLAEVQRAASRAFSSIHGLWSEYIGLRQVRSENEALARQLQEAQVALQQQRALADRSRSLERLLDLRDRSNLDTAAAAIIAAGASPDFRTLTIDKGSSDGVNADMAVIAPEGVVGRIVLPSRRAAKIQLLIDRNAAVGALLERSRVQGVVVGSGDELLRLQYVPEVADVTVGDLVVTSGIDGIYPKGYLIGRIESIEKSGGAFENIAVRPAVDFTSLEEVLVVLTPTPAQDAAEGSVE